MVMSSRRASALLVALGALAAAAACAQSAPVCPPPPPPAPCNCDLAPLASAPKPTIDDPVHAKDASPPDPAPVAAAADASADAAVVAVVDAPKDAGAAPHSKPAPKPVAATPDPSSCGTKENLCPLQKMMRGEMTGATTGPALAAAFAHAANLSPNPGWSWRAISMKGVELAKAGDIPGAKAQCKACHEAYKAPYKATYRARAVR